MRYHRFPKQLQEYYVCRLRETYAKRCAELDAIKAPADALAHRKKVRRQIRRCFAPMPKKCPLKPKVTRTTDHGDFRIEHVLYESRPGYKVSANLYLPPEIPASGCPAVLFTCGHSPVGKAHPLYTEACIRLVRQGFVVLSYDPINQGERDLYAMLDVKDRPTRNSPCNGHNIIGKQMLACGEWLGTWRLWDGMGGVDYLLTRPEVDSTRIGVTGQSGGGTMSSYLWAMDDRLAAVASSCWVTSYLNDIENGMPADSEQYPPGFLKAGLDKIDLFVARAGEPALLLGQEQDFFDDRGLRAGHRELRRIHQLVGGDKKTCRLSLDTGTHAFSEANQREMIRFFCRVFGVRQRRAPEPSAIPEPELQVTPECDVNQYGSRPAHEIVAKRARQIVKGRPKQKGLDRRVRKFLNVGRVPKRPHHRRLFQAGEQRACTGQNVYRFVVETEAGIQCVLRRVTEGKTPFRMQPAGETTLYLPNTCSQQELANEAVMAGHKDFWTLDVRGLGEGAISPADVLLPYGHDYMHTGHGLMYGEPLLGRRAFDILCAVNLLRAEGAEVVHLTGRRQGGILALLAGVLDGGIQTVSCLETSESILELTCSPLCNWPTVNFPRGVLRVFDLPGLRRNLGKRLVADSRSAGGAFPG